MNGRPWLPHELDFLRQWYGVLVVKDIAQIMKRGVAGVRTKAQELKLTCRTDWTPELDEFLTLLYPDTPAGEIAQVLGVTAAALHARARALGVSKAPGFASEISRRTTLARSPFTPEIIATIERLYPTTLTEELAAMVAMETSRVHAYANSRGWKKTPEFVRETARARSGPDHPMRQTQFKKGLSPWNKGTKGIVGVQEGCRATQFKKGQMAGAAQHNYKPIGTLRINAEGYLERKVTDDPSIVTSRRWVPVSRLVWEAAHGPIPPGHAVVFKPGRQTTDVDAITLDALELLTRAELMRRNSVHTVYPPEVARLAQLRGALNRQINKRSRALQEQS